MKNGIDRFPCETVIDNSLIPVINEFGIKARGVVVELLCKIYGEEGYYCVWNESVALVFAQQRCAGAKAVPEIVNSLVRNGFFDRQKYKDYGILTSAKIQQTYMEETRRRRAVEMVEAYICVDNIAKNVYISAKNVYKNRENVYIFAADGKEKVREKERKEKRTKREKKEKENPKRNNISSTIQDCVGDAMQRARAGAPPSMKEIQDYLTKKRYTFTAERFVSYYKDHPPFPYNWQRVCDVWEERQADRDYELYR